MISTTTSAVWLDRTELWSQSKLGAASAGDRVAVTLILPSELLPRGDYSIRLSGLSSSGDLELVGRYYFRSSPHGPGRG